VQGAIGGGAPFAKAKAKDRVICTWKTVRGFPCKLTALVGTSYCTRHKPLIGFADIGTYQVKVVPGAGVPQGTLGAGGGAIPSETQPGPAGATLGSADGGAIPPVAADTVEKSSVGTSGAGAEGAGSDDTPAEGADSDDKPAEGTCARDEPAEGTGAHEPAKGAGADDESEGSGDESAGIGDESDGSGDGSEGFSDVSEGSGDGPEGSGDESAAEGADASGAPPVSADADDEGVDGERT
jgi:hypothetical protein